ncbi:MAG: tRNA (guanosine(46)-N7)-methyltransferase TrmB [Arsenophonus sp. ET-KM2-MAG3]
MIKNVFTPEVDEEGKVIRRIHSFVRRHRQLSLCQKNILKILWLKMGIDFTDQLLLFSSLFKNSEPVILEIGFGTGASLVNMAKKNMTKNFLGIEVYIPGICACLSAAKQANLNNLRVICHDAIEVLEKMIPTNSLNIIQLFFPDPWNKTKHNKRRIIQQSFANLILDKLKLGGMFYIATDWQPYAEYILNVMNKISGYRNLSETDNYVQRPSSRLMTKFEKRAEQFGHRVFDLIFEKIR